MGEEYEALGPAGAAPPEPPPVQFFSPQPPSPFSPIPGKPAPPTTSVSSILDQKHQHKKLTTKQQRK
uniref:Uncharacterized protein n=1 Tax=Loa loa TaxID=7209 RepID=A0A1I7VC93_LOALO